MRLAGQFLTLCLAMAVLTAAAKVLALTIVGAVVISLLLQTKQTFGCLLGLMCLGLIGQYPVLSIFVLGAVMIVGKLAQTRK